MRNRQFTASRILMTTGFLLHFSQDKAAGHISTQLQSRIRPSAVGYTLQVSLEVSCVTSSVRGTGTWCRFFLLL